MPEQSVIMHFIMILKEIFMRSYIDCVHCYLKQVVSCMTFAEIDEDRQHDVLYRLMDYIKTLDRYDSPAENSSLVILKAYELMGCSDPYKDAKKLSNDLALSLYARLCNEVKTTPGDRLYKALKIAVAGNTIDLGINRSFDIEESLRHSLNIGFTLDHYRRFLQKLEDIDEVLFLGDNAGEIVFDRILVEELAGMGKKVTYVIKEGPVLNDSTMEDALYTGMDSAARVITCGSNFLGTCLKTVSAPFLKLFKESRLVIAKGQANFETLEQEDSAEDRIFFLLKMKCEYVARAAGARFGDVVFFTR
jgi:hypothetical protein